MGSTALHHEALILACRRARALNREAPSVTRQALTGVSHDIPEHRRTHRSAWLSYL